MAHCLLCKLREGCKGAYHIAGDCFLFSGSTREDTYQTSEGTNYPEGTQGSGFNQSNVVIKPKSTLTLVAQEKKYCDYIIGKIKDDIEEELDCLISERENYIGDLPKEMFVKIVDLRDTLITLKKICNFAGYTIDVGDYIKDLDTKIIELGGKYL